MRVLTGMNTARLSAFSHACWTTWFEINGLPLEQQRHEIENKRRHGMGYLGLGSTTTMLGMKYGDEASLELTERVTKEMAIVGWEAALELA